LTFSAAAENEPNGRGGERPRLRGAQGRKPVVRLRCADYGDEWVVNCDVYPVDELSVQPRTAGPYSFGTAGEAKQFVETSLLALQILGCDLA